MKVHVARTRANVEFMGCGLQPPTASQRGKQDLMQKYQGNGFGGRDGTAAQGGVVLSAEDLDMIVAYKYKPGALSFCTSPPDGIMMPHHVHRVLFLPILPVEAQPRVPTFKWAFPKN